MVMHRLASGMRDSVLHEVSEERNLRVVTTKTNHSIVTMGSSDNVHEIAQ